MPAPPDSHREEVEKLLRQLLSQDHPPQDLRRLLTEALLTTASEGLPAALTRLRAQLEAHGRAQY